MQNPTCLSLSINDAFWKEIKLTLGWNELAEIRVRHLECKSSLIFFEQKPKVCLKIKSDTF